MFLLRIKHLATIESSMKPTGIRWPLRSAAKTAFDAYKKENGSDKKLPRISELNEEYAMLLERKKNSYAEYRKTKSEMQDWLVAQKIVQEILKEDEQKKEQMHEKEVRQEEENKENSR